MIFVPFDYYCVEAFAFVMAAKVDADDLFQNWALIFEEEEEKHQSPA